MYMYIGNVHIYVCMSIHVHYELCMHVKTIMVVEFPQNVHTHSRAHDVHMYTCTCIDLKRTIVCQLARISYILFIHVHVYMFYSTCTGQMGGGRDKNLLSCSWAKIGTSQVSHD